MNAPVTLATEFMLYVASTHVKTLKHGKVAVSCPDLKMHQSVCLSDMPKLELGSVSTVLCIHANDSVELKFRAALDGAVTNLTFNRLFVMQGRLFDVELSTSSATKTFVDIAWN